MADQLVYLVVTDQPFGGQRRSQVFVNSTNAIKYCDELARIEGCQVCVYEKSFEDLTHHILIYESQDS
jgi:hypothetical protein